MSGILSRRKRAAKRPNGLSCMRAATHRAYLGAGKYKCGGSVTTCHGTSDQMPMAIGAQVHVCVAFVSADKDFCDSISGKARPGIASEMLLRLRASNSARMRLADITPSAARVTLWFGTRSVADKQNVMSPRRSPGGNPDNGALRILRHFAILWGQDRLPHVWVGAPLTRPLWVRWRPEAPGRSKCGTAPAISPLRSLEKRPTLPVAEAGQPGVTRLSCLSHNQCRFDRYACSCCLNRRCH